MRRYVIAGGLILAVVVIAALIILGGNVMNHGAQTSNDDTGADDDGTKDESGTTTAGRVLVVYYSASGNTEKVAEYIAEATNGTLFEVTPTVPYTSTDLNWNVSDSRVNKEHEDESLRDVPLTTTTVENWDEYDTVFIGYPIWWGIAAWPIDNFVKDSDFTGKTVIPFATSSSSGMGESGDLLEGMTGTGDWQDGHRFSSSASRSDVESWVNGLGLH